jgi:hypothetical protein
MHAWGRDGKRGRKSEGERGSVAPCVCGCGAESEVAGMGGVGQPGLVEGAPLRWERGVGHLGAVRVCVGCLWPTHRLFGEVAPKKAIPNPQYLNLGESLGNECGQCSVWAVWAHEKKKHTAITQTTATVCTSIWAGLKKLSSTQHKELVTVS